MIELLNVVMPVMVDCTVSVNVTANALPTPGWICVPCPVQVMVMYVLAVEGLQLPTLMLRVMGAPPVSST